MQPPVYTYKHSNASEALVLERGQQPEGVRLEAFAFISACPYFTPVGDCRLYYRVLALAKARPRWSQLRGAMAKLNSL